MLPGKAISEPTLSRLRSRLAQKATPTPQAGPRNTAQSTFTMCCVGEQLLPRKGNWINTLPTTATATKMAEMASFFVLTDCMFSTP